MDPKQTPNPPPLRAEPKIPSRLTYLEFLGLILIVALLSLMLWPVFYHTPWPQ